MLSSVTIDDSFRVATVAFDFWFTFGIRPGRVGKVVDLILVVTAPPISAAKLPLLDAALRFGLSVSGLNALNRDDALRDKPAAVLPSPNVKLLLFGCSTGGFGL